MKMTDVVATRRAMMIAATGALLGCGGGEEEETVPSRQLTEEEMAVSTFGIDNNLSSYDPGSFIFHDEQGTFFGGWINIDGDRVIKTALVVPKINQSASEVQSGDHIVILYDDNQKPYFMINPASGGNIIISYSENETRVGVYDSDQVLAVAVGMHRSISNVWFRGMMGAIDAPFAEWNKIEDVSGQVAQLTRAKFDLIEGGLSQRARPQGYFESTIDYVFAGMVVGALVAVAFAAPVTASAVGISTLAGAVIGVLAGKAVKWYNGVALKKLDVEFEKFEIMQLDPKTKIQRQRALPSIARSDGSSSIRCNFNISIRDSGDCSESIGTKSLSGWAASVTLNGMPTGRFRINYPGQIIIFTAPGSTSTGYSIPEDGGITRVQVNTSIGEGGLASGSGRYYWSTHASPAKGCSGQFAFSGKMFPVWRFNNSEIRMS
jgi:hypothetical protein